MQAILTPTRLPAITRHIPTALAAFISFVFVQSLFFKFTGSPETVYIFETKLDAWAASFGAGGLFAPGGLFSAQVIGSVELLAAALLIVGSLTRALRRMQVAGAALALGVISGAIGFHLFTPLGIAVANADGSLDGGALFATAVMVWMAAAAILVARRDVIRGLARRS